MMLDFKIFWSVFVFVLTVSFATNSYATFDSQGGMGLDIIQGKSNVQFWISGESCGVSQIFVTDDKGNSVLCSPVFVDAQFIWQVDASDWEEGIYQVTAQSEYCVLVEDLEL